MSEQNYGELFCEAVDTIVKQRLQGVAFDQTVLCTVVDDSKREQGIYKVSNGSSQFEAYSSITDYRNNSNVYVQIPRGDWNSSKFIIGKKNKEDVEEAFIYKNPLSSFIDITKNIIPIDFTESEGSLIANLSEDKILWSYNNAKEKALYSKEGKSFNSYTRLGIQASFRSWLNPFTAEDGKVKNVTQGIYGLKLRLAVLKDKTVDEEEQKIEYYDFLLNTNDMNGNPYNFSTYFQQEKLFDISDFREIKSMSLSFYQDNNFKSNDDSMLPSKDFLGNDLIQPNLFVKDIYISLGYGTEEFEDEKVLLFTDNDSSYKKTVNPEYKNQKQIELRWIHKRDDGSYQSVTEDDKLDFEIRWYRYSLGAPSVDEYSDVYWKLLSLQSTKHDGKAFWDEDTEDKIFNKIFDNLIKDNGYYVDQKKEQNQEQIIYIDINKEFQKNNSRYFIRDKRWIEDNHNLKSGSEENWKEYTRYPDFFSTWIMPSLALPQEQVKAVIIYNGKAYYSNTITFTNEDEVVSRPTVDAIQALTINCEDGTYGNYRIYAEGNQLINSKDASIKREFELYFKSEYDETEPTYWKDGVEVGESVEGAEPRYPLIAARNVEWIFPSENSMIKLPSEYIDYFAGRTEKNPKEDELGNLYWIDDNKNYHIKRFGNASKSFEINNKQPYYIGSYYSEQYSNNTITCTIEKEPNIFFTATKTLTFGIAGTTGTDVTLVIDFKNSSKQAVDVDADEAYEIIANLYDSENKNVTQDVLSNENCRFSWTWISNTDGTLRNGIEGNNLIIQSPSKNSCFIQKKQSDKKEITEEDWDILVCKLNGWGDYELIAYFPIPLKRSINGINPLFISGTKQIIYNTEGIPNYYKGPYELYCDNNYQSEPFTENIIWSISYEDESDINAQKRLTEINNELNKYVEKYNELEAELDNDEKVKLYLERKLEENTITDDERKDYFQIQDYEEEKNLLYNVNVKEKNSRYKPKLVKEENESLELKNSLQACNLFVEDSSYGISVLCSLSEFDENTNTTKNTIIWSQPLLIIQNRYPSAMLNKWDGSLTIDEEENSILASKIAAGKKNKYDNTFSGVLMGELGTVNGGASSTGIYGFHHGATSFGFKDDGTAFIGKSGYGRIQFDGNKGIIESGSWSTNNTGMHIDLDDSIINMAIIPKDNNGDGLPSNKSGWLDTNILSEEDYNNYYSSPDSYDEEKVALYKFREYVFVEKSDIIEDEQQKYYKPYSYEAIQLTGAQYKKLMEQDYRPRFYSRYQYLKFEEAIKEPDDESLNIGDITTGGIFYPGSDIVNDELLYGDNSVIVTAEYKYYLLKISTLEKDNLDLLVDEDNDAQAGAVNYYSYAPTKIQINDDEDPSNNTTIFEIFIPSDFIMVSEEEKNTIIAEDDNDSSYGKESEYCLYKQLKIDDKHKPEKTDSLASIYDPTFKYYHIKNQVISSDIGENEDDGRYITISAANKNVPLSIGYQKAISSRKFRVDWDGTVHIEDGDFSGTINATSGTLGNLRVYGTLSGGVIAGAQISGSSIKGGSVEANMLTCYNGNIGGWRISRYGLQAGKIILDSLSGQITGGTIRGSKIYSTDGEIGGWIIKPGKLYGGKRTVGTDNNVVSNYTIELDSVLGAIRGGAILTNYQFGNNQNLGTVDTLQGGTILDGFFTIGVPSETNTGTSTTKTLPKKLDKSYLGYIGGGLSNSSVENELSKGIAMMMGNGYYEGSGLSKSDWFSIVTATSSGAGLAVSTGSPVSSPAVQAIADDGDTGGSEGEDSGGSESGGSGSSGGTPSENSAPYNKIFVDEDGIYLSTEINTTSENPSYIKLNTNNFNIGNVNDTGFNVIASSFGHINAVTLNADSSGSTGIVLNHTGTAGQITIQSANSIYLSNGLGQFISMGHQKEEGAAMLLNAIADDGNTGGSEGGGVDNPSSDSGSAESDANYIEISPGISIGKTAFFSSGELKLQSGTQKVTLTTDSLGFSGTDNLGAAASYGSTGFSSSGAIGTISGGGGSLTVTTTNTTTITGGTITTENLTVNTQTTLNHIKVSGECEGLYALLG